MACELIRNAEHRPELQRKNALQSGCLLLSARLCSSPSGWYNCHEAVNCYKAEISPWSVKRAHVWLLLSKCKEGSTPVQTLCIRVPQPRHYGLLGPSHSVWWRPSCTVTCLVVPLASTPLMPLPCPTPLHGCVSQKCIQTLTMSPGAGSPLLENHCRWISLESICLWNLLKDLTDQSVAEKGPHWPWPERLCKASAHCHPHKHSHRQDWCVFALK